MSVFGGERADLTNWGSMSIVLVADLHNHLDLRFPFGGAAEWDPVGLQLGSLSEDAGDVAVCHEVSGDVVEWVIESSVRTLISYHPLLFTPVTSIVEGSTPQGRALRLLRGGVNLIVVHTAMDAATRGTGDSLLADLGIAVSGSFADAVAASVDNTVDITSSLIGRYGDLDESVTVGAFASKVSEFLSTTVQFAGDPNQLIRTVSVVPGSGSEFIKEAAALSDVLVTGDVSHHRAQGAVGMGLAVVDAGHIPTERPGVRELYSYVRETVNGAVFIESDPHPWEDATWRN